MARPGGLYLALLLRRRAAGWRVTVHETTPPDRTFGFGVGLTGSTLRALAGADRESHDAIVAVSPPVPRLEFRLPGGRAAIATMDLAIECATLLQLLWARVEASGAHLEVGPPALASELDGADVIVAADGAGSQARQALADELGAEVEPGTGWYLWAGTDVALDHALFAPERTEHGVFVTHAYPYAPDRSTFLVETDEATWRSAGFGRRRRRPRRRLRRRRARVPLRRVRAAPGRAPPDREPDALAAVPDGALRALARRAHGAARGRGAHGALLRRLGDEARDGGRDRAADALARRRLETGRWPPTRRAATGRRPASGARRALAAWWETFPARAHLPVPQLAVAFLTRAGNVRLPDISGGDRTVLADAAARLGASEPTTEALLGAALRVNGLDLPGRLLGSRRTWSRRSRSTASATARRRVRATSR